jgi:hypothetical protein
MLPVLQPVIRTVFFWIAAGDMVLMEVSDEYGQKDEEPEMCSGQTANERAVV